MIKNDKRKIRNCKYDIDLIINDLKAVDEYNRYKYSMKEISYNYNLSVQNVSSINKRFKIRNGSIIDNHIIINDLKSVDEYGNYIYSQKEITEKYNIYPQVVRYINTIYSIRNIKKYKKKRNINYNIYSIINDLKFINNDRTYKNSQVDIAKKHNISQSVISVINKKYKVR